MSSTHSNGTIHPPSASPRRERRPRTGKKRLKFEPPQRFARGVRELWQSATVNEQQRAHQACVQILAMWLGKRSRAAVAGELSIPPLRVWQLSQQALSGMLAGLLHQPRPKRRVEVTTMDERADSTSALKRRIAELEKDVETQRELLQLIASVPKPRSGPPDSTTPSASPTPAAKTTRAAQKPRRARAEAPPRDGLDRNEGVASR
jgi:hypothetical protein